MSQKKPSRRSFAALGAIAALAVAFVVVPTVAAPAFASDTSSASSLFAKLNQHREIIPVADVAPNGYANITAQERAVLSSHGSFDNPADAAPSTPQAPVFDVPIYAHVSKGSSTATRLFAKLIATSSAVINFSSYNVAGVGVHTRGSTVYGVIEMLAYNSGELPGGYLGLAKPTITGTVAVGHTLTAHHAAAVPDNGDTTGIFYSGDWYSGATNIGSGSTLHITAGMLGEKITLGVTVSKTGFVERTVRSSATKTVAKGTFKVTGPTNIVQALGALWPDLGSVTPSGTNLYRWYSNGHAMSGSTSTLQFHVPVVGDIGKKLSVHVAMTSPGYTSKTFTFSMSSTFPGLRYTTTFAPTISGYSGTPEVGDTLHSAIATWTPAATNYAITWKANGATITGQHGVDLVLTNARVGKKITVTYRGTTTLYAPTSLTSATTPKVIAGP